MSTDLAQDVCARLLFGITETELGKLTCALSHVKLELKSKGSPFYLPSKLAKEREKAMT